MVNVICVFKEGNGFNSRYVKLMEDFVSANTTIPFSFRVFDEGRFVGWWNKIEVFKMTGPCVYIDLDTVILGNIDSLLSLAINTDKFHMLRPFNPVFKYGRWASGLMVWNGEYKSVLKDFDANIHTKKHRGDQTYISSVIGNDNISAIQDSVTGIYSYKKHCTEELPADARIVCFHGNPRPAGIGVKLPWMKEWEKAYRG